MNTVRNSILCLVVLLIVGVALAQGTYTQIDVPGAGYTYVYGINSAGDLVGVYLDTSHIQRGFLLSGGTFTTIDPGNGGSTWTWAMGINDHGKVVGFGTIAFVYDIQSQIFTNIGIRNLPTTPQAINNAGTIVGNVVMGSTQVGFELSPGHSTRIYVPGTKSTLPWGISSSGVIVGFGEPETGGIYSFALEGGKYKVLKLGGMPTEVLGINPQGTALVGLYGLSGVTVGFLYESNTLTTLQFPGATSTVAIGVNKAGQVAGCFTDAANGNHGFLWTPPAPSF